VRVLHPVHPDEVLLRRGRYRYLKGSEPTGDVETWQVTRLPDGDEVVRADLDGRRAGRPNLITHLRRKPSGAPAWLRLRYFGGPINTAAQYTFREDTVRVARMTGDFQRWQEVVEIVPGSVVDYHPVIGTDYVWRGYPTDAGGEERLIPVFSPDLWEAEDHVLAGRALRVSVSPRAPEACLTPAGEFEEARSFHVRFDDGVEALVWFDELGTPLRWHYPAAGYEIVLLAYHIA
jgi:hypothetical protein